MSHGRDVLELIDVDHTYRTEHIQTRAVRGATLRIGEGEYVSIVGPSGSGKSTLLGLMGLLERPISGRIRLFGEETTSLSEARRAEVRNRKIGFVFQAFNLIAGLTVAGNVALPLTLRRDLSRAEITRRVEEAVDSVGLASRIKHRPFQLSGGQQQRVAIARALVGCPSLLLADEPTGNLDSENAQLVLEQLRRINRGGCTICLVTHSVELTRESSRTLVVRDGRICQAAGGKRPEQVAA